MGVFKKKHVREFQEETLNLSKIELVIESKKVSQRFARDN